MHEFEEKIFFKKLVFEEKTNFEKQILKNSSALEKLRFVSIYPVKCA